MSKIFYLHFYTIGFFICRKKKQNLHNLKLKIYLYALYAFTTLKLLPIRRILP